MVLAASLSLLFDLLHCSIPQTRTKCCLEFAVVSGYRMFLGLSGSALPPPTVLVGRALQRPPPISKHQKDKSNSSVADRPGLEPAFCGVCVWGVPPPLAQGRPRSQKSGQNGGSTSTPSLDKAVHARNTRESKARTGLTKHDTMHKQLSNYSACPYSLSGASDAME